MPNAVTVRFYAAAAEAAGTKEISVPLGTESVTLNEFLESLPKSAPGTVDSGGRSLSGVCGYSSFLINSVQASPSQAHLTAGDTLDILPPFAGG